MKLYLMKELDLRNSLCGKTAGLGNGSHEMDLTDCCVLL